MSGFAATDTANFARELQRLEVTSDGRKRNLEQLGQILALGLRKRSKRILDLRIQRFVIASRSNFQL